MYERFVLHRQVFISQKHKWKQLRRAAFSAIKFFFSHEPADCDNIFEKPKFIPFFCNSILWPRKFSKHQFFGKHADFQHNSRKTLCTIFLKTIIEISPPSSAYCPARPNEKNSSRMKSLTWQAMFQELEKEKKVNRDTEKQLQIELKVGAHKNKIRASFLLEKC